MLWHKFETIESFWPLCLAPPTRGRWSLSPPLLGGASVFATIVFGLWCTMVPFKLVSFSGHVRLTLCVCTCMWLTQFPSPVALRWMGLVTRPYPNPNPQPVPGSLRSVKFQVIVIVVVTILRRSEFSREQVPQFELQVQGSDGYTPI